MDDFSKNLSEINLALEAEFESLRLSSQTREEVKLCEAMSYAVLGSGKRFRPLLTQLTSELFKKDSTQTLPFALAVEFIHAYSLVHDDLPSLDNDDLRRGKPTVHKAFGEAMAILTGDALLSHAFSLASRVRPEPFALRAISELSEAIGPKGMVGGQVIDVFVEDLNYEALKRIHSLKTGALIRASVVGSAEICEGSKVEVESLRHFSTQLGWVFQLVDDLLDQNEANEKVNLSLLKSEKDLRAQIEAESEEALAHLKQFGDRASGLRAIVEFNRSRSH